jgi:hypothetical protein
MAVDVIWCCVHHWWGKPTARNCVRQTPTVAQLLYKLLFFYVTRKFITVFTTARYVGVLE